MPEEKVAAIILAAGESKRLGRPKQLLDWFGIPFIVKIIDTATESGLYPVVVVTGAHYQEVEKCVQNKEICILRNKQWKKGQSSSIIQGINALNEDGSKSFMVLLCDQPQVPNELIRKLVLVSKENIIDIVATSVNGKICPPILFKPICIDELKKLQGDQGGKGILEKFKVKTVKWKDERLILDTDTEEDYAILINAYK
jgi:molybdenum cofactor cytidylyltransferase